VFENRALGRRRNRNMTKMEQEGLHNSYLSSNIVRKIKRRGMK
jgi:hypothetical protein